LERKMLASEVVAQLQKMIEAHGDHEVVSGVDRSGYGEPVEDVDFNEDERLQDIDGNPVKVFDLLLSDDSLCSVGGF
jgi:hypothetical protein